MQKQYKIINITRKRLVKTTTFVGVFLVIAILIASNVITANIISNIATVKTDMNETNTLVDAARDVILKEPTGKFAIKVDTHTKKKPFTDSMISKPVNALLEEGFEDTWVQDDDGDLAPPGWQVINNSEGYNINGEPMWWHQDDTHVYNGDYSAGISYDDDWSDGSINQDEWLISPNITLEKDSILQFWSWFSGNDKPVVDHDYVKIYNGSGWTIIDDLSYNHESNYFDSQLEYDLSAYTGQTIKIAFNRYWMGPWTENYIHTWWVDDVVLSEIEVHDVGVISIENPVDGVTTGVITPEVTVKNFGSVNEFDVPVNLVIVNESGYEEYNQIEYVDLDINETKNVIFSDWTLDDWQKQGNVDLLFFVTACTQLEDDENSGNDCDSKEVILHLPYLHDVGVIGIDSPNGNGPVQTLPVKSTIKNMGQYNECCFKTYAEIAEVDLNSAYTIWSSGFDDGSYYTLPFGWSQSREDAWYFDPINNYIPGATAPNAQLPLNTTLNGDWLMSPTIDTSDAGKMDLELKSFIDVDDFGGNCSFHVEIRSGSGVEWVDITPWANPINGDVGPETYTIDASVGIGCKTQIRFRFSGDPYNFDYWYLDNITLIGYTVLEPEYYDFVCIEPFDPGETKELQFDDWTPAAFEQGISGTKAYRVKSWSKMCDPQDENPSNDASQVVIELSYMHDVAVKEIIPPEGNRNSGDRWIYFDDGEVHAGIGLNGGGTFQGAIRITPFELAEYDGWELTKVKFYHYQDGMHNGTVIIYDAGTPTQPGSVITIEPFSATGRSWQEITLFKPVTVYKNKDIWVSVNIPHAGGEYPLAADNGPAVDGKGDWVSTDGVNWDELQNIDTGLDLNWMIRAYITGQASSDIYISAGTYPIEAIILNNGTFTESNFTTYANITKEEITVYESNCTIDELEVGDETTTDFDNWSVSESGVYKLEVIAELENDDFPDNNKEELFIYVDAKRPETTHTLNPATPDGLNGWYVSDVTVTLYADDGTEQWQSGVREIKYRINGGGVQTIPSDHGSFKITEDGANIQVEYWSVDKVGNEETPHASFDIKMDQTTPTINLIKEKTGGTLIKKFLFTADVHDEMSGIDKVEFYLDDTLESTADTEPYEWEWQGIGNHTVHAIVYDLAGNNAMSNKHYTPLNNNQVQTKNNVVEEVINNQQQNSQTNNFITNNYSTTVTTNSEIKTLVTKLT